MHKTAATLPRAAALTLEIMDTDKHQPDALFLPRDAMLSTVYAVVVCLSVTLRCCIKTAKRMITQIMPHDMVDFALSSVARSIGVSRYICYRCGCGQRSIASRGTTAPHFSD